MKTSKAIKKVGVVFGTRPEAIKMIPIIFKLYQSPTLEPVVIVTAQHREMLDQVLKTFSITVDYDLDIMTHQQSLSQITATVLTGLEEVFIQEALGLVLVHGDTTTSLAASLAAYYQKIPIGHVEAGLRTYDKYSPYPEEANRQMIDTISDIWFTPTPLTQKYLLQEHRAKEHIYVTGNTVIDTLHYTQTLSCQHPILDVMNASSKRFVLLTMHRRENIGEPMERVCRALNQLTADISDIDIIIPVHLNPQVQTIVKRAFQSNVNVHLIDPLPVDVFHQVIGQSTLILTDSGGLQEEAPALDIPVLVLRESTERPEGVKAGTLKVIGTDCQAVYEESKRLLTQPEIYQQMASASNPYGDGTASQQIVSIIERYMRENLIK